MKLRNHNMKDSFSDIENNLAIDAALFKVHNYPFNNHRKKA